MTIAVFGAGALGSLLAGMLRLSKPDGEIWLVGGEHSGEHLNVIEKQGLTIEFSQELAAKWPFASRFLSSPDGYIVVKGLRIATRPEQVEDKIEIALVAVKSYQTAAIIPQIAASLSPNGFVVTFQNGLGNLEQLQAVLGSERVTQAVTSSGARLAGPGRILFAGLGSTAFAEYKPTEITKPRLIWLPTNLILTGMLAQVGLPLVYTKDLTSLVWGKLIVNCAINPLTALLNSTNGGLLENPASLELLEAVAAETAMVARRAKIALPYPYKQAAEQARRVAEITAANTSSMLADVRRGSPTEIEAINGAVVRLAESIGVAAPLNKTLYQLVKALEK